MARSKHTPHLDSDQDGLSPATSHPDYVAVAPEWFWSTDDPRAPFGSDDGHDTLSTLQEHFIQGGGDEHVPGCIANLIVDWALVPEQLWDSSAEEITAWLDADENHARFLHGEIDDRRRMRAVQDLRVDPPGAAVLGRTRPDAPRARPGPVGAANLRY